MNPNLCAAILAGGKSSRMGREKALIEIDSEPIISRTARALRPLFSNTVVVTTNLEISHKANLPSIPDPIAEKGPLAGVYAALSHFQQPTFCVACDMPYLNGEFLKFQISKWHNEFDVLVPESEDGLEPLHAIWSPLVLPQLKNWLEEAKVPSLRRIVKSLNYATIALEEAKKFDSKTRFFSNWNAPEDIENT